MLNAINIAQSGLAAASQRLEFTAAGVAASGSGLAPRDQSQNRTETVSNAPGVRVGYLPLPGNPAGLEEQMTSLIEDEMAFKANAAVLKTAAGMIAALYESVD